MITSHGLGLARILCKVSNAFYVNPRTVLTASPINHRLGLSCSAGEVGGYCTVLYRRTAQLIITFVAAREQTRLDTCIHFQRLLKQERC